MQLRIPNMNHLSKLFTSEEYCDVHFLCSDNKKVSAVKSILAVGSDVFHALLYSRNFQSDNTFHIEDLDSQIFSLIVRYVYGLPVEVDGDNCLELLYAAQKYQFVELINGVIDFLMDCVTEENCVMVYQQALQLGNERLKENALDAIARYFESIANVRIEPLLSDDFLGELLRRNVLSLESEIVLFNRILEWSNRGLCNVENIIKDIRFCSINKDDYYNVVAPLDIVPEDMKKTLVSYYNTGNCTDDIWFKVRRPELRFTECFHGRLYSYISDAKIWKVALSCDPISLYTKLVVRFIDPSQWFLIGCALSNASTFVKTFGSNNDIIGAWSFEDISFSHQGAGIPGNSPQFQPGDVLELNVNLVSNIMYYYLNEEFIDSTTSERILQTEKHVKIAFTMWQNHSFEVLEYNSCEDSSILRPSSKFDYFGGDNQGVQCQQQ